MTPERYRKLCRVLAHRQDTLSVLLDSVHKPHNIAAVVRTCDAVGVGRIHAVSSDPEFAHHHGISGGSRKWVETEVHADLDAAAAALRRDGMQIVAAHPGPECVDFRAVDYTRPTALLMGAERWGVSAPGLAQADRQVRIPMVGMVASLNVSVAAAVLLYEVQRQREAAGMYAPRELSSPALQARLFEWAYPRIAARCRREHRPYPPLRPDGSIAAALVPPACRGVPRPLQGAPGDTPERS